MDDRSLRSRGRWRPFPPSFFFLHPFSLIPRTSSLYFFFAVFFFVVFFEPQAPLELFPHPHAIALTSFHSRSAAYLFLSAWASSSSTAIFFSISDILPTIRVISGSIAPKAGGFRLARSYALPPSSARSFSSFRWYSNS